MPDEKKTFLVDLEPVGRRIQVIEGQSLLESAQAAGVELVAVCGGIGICQGCRVRLAKGELTPLTLEEEADLTLEEIHEGYRLACQSMPLSDCRIEIPPESLTTPQRLQVEGKELEIQVDPLIIPLDVKMDRPTLHDLRSDATRLKEAVACRGHPEPRLEFPLLHSLSDRLRELNWAPRLAMRGNEVVGLLPALESRLGRLFGLAVDVGTTKLAHYLVDLETAEVVARAGAMNPQISYGEDVISRIMTANERPDGRKIMQERVVDTINQSVEELCSQAGIERQQIVEAVVVGNTVMHHLFAGLPVRQLGLSPYVASVAEPIEFRAETVGLRLAPGAYIYMPANIAGYVGADHISMLLASDIEKLQVTTIALDIGTNTEISLIANGRILSCSCASGPAFEGAHIQDGMRAAPGAIERVTSVEGQLRVHTIGEQPPVGICGSGILDAVASLIQAGAIDQRGNLLSDHPLVVSRNGQRLVILVTAGKTGHGRDIVITRKDINEIQLAKGAIRAGIEVLLAHAGPIKLEEVIVAGAFGTYLDIASAVRVGMFPALPLGSFKQIGNAAGAGARQMLVSAEQRRKAARIAEKVEYIELTTHPGFTERFVKAIMFG